MVNPSQEAFRRGRMSKAPNNKPYDKSKAPDRPVTYCVSPLRSTTTADTLRDYFERFGPVSAAHIVYESTRRGVRSRRMGYVTFEDPEIAAEVRGQWRKKHVVDGVNVRLEFYDHEREMQRCLRRIRSMVTPNFAREHTGKTESGRGRGGPSGSGSQEQKKSLLDKERADERLGRMSYIGRPELSSSRSYSVY
ncbi:hypothetical protein QR680_006706 [Steinernema hermaphroditum]|uniref:RRM domain-containing protein n=1 Tax=Steinernema hermaphroditum TaxID=289476 RepID=A0AA39HYG8_9BILA|nr:hypothetical protein QR680_006706 [Steinernema hermaphroditum]